MKQKTYQHSSEKIKKISCLSRQVIRRHFLERRGEGERLDRRGRQGRIVQVDFGSHELNDDFAETLGKMLRRFIEVVTPAVDNFMDERNEEDTDTIRLPAIPLTLTMKFVNKHNEEDA